MKDDLWPAGETLRFRIWWRWRMFLAHLAYLWWRSRNLVLALARPTGPECGCGERAWSGETAYRCGWRHCTWYAHGEPGWVCPDCLRNGQENPLR